MAISRGLRKVSKSKAEAEIIKKHNLTIKATSKKKRKKHLRVQEGRDLSQKRKRVRARYRNKKEYTSELKRAKRQAIKEKKKAKKQAHAGIKIKQPKSEQQKAIDKQLKQFKKEWKKQLEEQKQQEDIPTFSDIVYSTFLSFMRDAGVYDDILKEIVQRSIDTFGMDEAMERLNRYMADTNDKTNIFNVYLQYEDPTMECISEFARQMSGGALSNAEIDSYHSRLEYLWVDAHAYKGSHSTSSYYRHLDNE